ncbi:MAG: TIGR04076 family protein [Actinobacteria bacterium]|nr:TIGR04076 family protein [Actinomycetota bacterium]
MSETPNEMTLFNLRVSVHEINGRSVCGMSVGDYFEVSNSDQLRIPDGGMFCFWAMQSIMPLLPAKMRSLPPGDWLEQDSLVCCPDPEEGLIMKIERIGTVTLKTSDLT